MKNEKNVLDYWQEIYKETHPVKRELFLQCWDKRDKKKFGNNAKLEDIEELFSTHDSALECILSAFDPQGLRIYKALEESVA